MDESKPQNEVDKFYTQLEQTLDREIAENRETFDLGYKVLSGLKKDVLDTLKAEGALDDLEIDIDELKAVYENPKILELCMELQIEDFATFQDWLEIAQGNEKAADTKKTDYNDTFFVGTKGLKLPILLPMDMSNDWGRKAVTPFIMWALNNRQFNQYFTADTEFKVYSAGYVRFEIEKDGKKVPYLITPQHILEVVSEPSKEEIEKLHALGHEEDGLNTYLRNVIKNNPQLSQLAKTLNKKDTANWEKAWKKVDEAKLAVQKAKEKNTGKEEALKELAAAREAAENTDFANIKVMLWQKHAHLIPREAKQYFEKYAEVVKKQDELKKTMVQKLRVVGSEEVVEREFSGSEGYLEYKLKNGRKYGTQNNFSSYRISFYDDEKDVEWEVSIDTKGILERRISYPEKFETYTYKNDRLELLRTWHKKEEVASEEFYDKDGKVVGVWWSKPGEKGPNYYDGETFYEDGKKKTTYVKYADGNYNTTIFDKEGQVVEKNGQATQGKIKYTFRDIYEGGKLNYSTFETENHVKSSVMYVDDQDVALFNQGKYPSYDAYLDFLARTLKTPEKLQLFVDLFLNYTYDDERAEWHEGRGGEEHWQSPEETIKRVREGKMQGDCEDWGLLIKEILWRQGKLAHVVLTNDHALCVWAEKRPDGRFDVYRLDTFGLQKVEAGNVAQGINELIYTESRTSMLQNFVEEEVDIGLVEEGESYQLKMPVEIFTDKELYEKMIVAWRLKEKGQFDEAKEICGELKKRYPQSKLVAKNYDELDKLVDEELIRDCENRMESGEIDFEQCQIVDKFYRLRGASNKRLSWNLKMMEMFPKKPEPYDCLLDYYTEVEPNLEKVLEICERGLATLPPKHHPAIKESRLAAYTNLVSENAIAKIVELFWADKKDLSGKFCYSVANYFQNLGYEQEAVKIYKDQIEDYERQPGVVDAAESLLFDKERAAAFPGAYLSYAKFLQKKGDKAEAERVLKLGLKYYKKDKPLQTTLDHLQGKDEIKVNKPGAVKGGTKGKK